MVKKLFVGLRMSKDTHVVDLAELRPAFIPKGHIVADIVLHPGNKYHAGLIPRIEHLKIHIAAVERYYRTGFERKVL